MPRLPVIVGAVIALSAFLSSAGAFACSRDGLVPDSEACLSGTMSIGEARSAVFRIGTQSATKHIGDEIEGWKVTGIDPRSVTLERRGETHVLALASQDAAREVTAAPPAPAKAEQRNVGPLDAGNAESVGTTINGHNLSISTHLPPIPAADY